MTFDGKSGYLQDTPQDREAKELRKFQVQEVARAFGVPAPLLNVDITNWGSGIEQLAKLFFRFGLRQHLDRILTPFQVRLLQPGDRFWVDTADLLRGDADAIHQMVMALRGDAQRPALASREELRHLAGLPRDVDGDLPVWPPAVTNASTDPRPAPVNDGGAAMTATEFQAARGELGLTIEALAERLGVDPRTVRRWQGGERTVSSQAAAALRGLLQAG